jgi:hypothetical protein
MRMQLPRAAAVTTTVAVVAVLASGVAYAYQRSTGSGTGSATTASGLAAFHTTATVAQGAKLYPGGTAPLTLNIDNTGNSYTLTVTSVALDSTRSVTGCTAPAITVAAGTWSGVVVAANSSSGAITIPGAVAMGLAASTDCQGASLTIPVTLTGHS